MPDNTKAFFQSPTTMAALGIIAGGMVALSHFLCLYANFCILEKITEAGWVLFLGAVGTIALGLYTLWKRLQAGKDPANPAPLITLLPPKKEG